MIEPPVAAEEDLPSVRQLPRLLAPFALPAYRKMAVALSCGAFAYGVWTVALVWEVIRLGGGPGQLSVVSTAGAVGVVLPSLLAGVVADRIPQKLIVMTVATAECVSYSVVAALSIAGVTQLWHLAVVSLCIGMGMAFYYAAYSAWLPSIVPASDLMAVNGFEGMVRPLVAQAIGPGVAGVVVGLASPGWACVVAAVPPGSAWSYRSSSRVRRSAATSRG
jgi:MFS family permease